MILLDNHCTNLADGYQRVRGVTRELLSKWRGRVLARYAYRYAAYQAAQAQHRARVRRLGPGLGFVMVAGVLLFFGSIFLRLFINETLCCARLLLIVTGPIVSLVAGIILFWLVGFSAPKPPQHPLHNPLKRKLFCPFLPLWREKLPGRLPGSLSYDGAAGEHDFVKSLQALRIGSSYVLYRLQQQYGDDVDVTIVGPKGIWVFEVKYWSGTIAWQNGQWAREQSYFESGGIPVTKSGHIGQPPDQQWQRMVDDVTKTLYRHAPILMAQWPALSRIKGGLVFTHPDASYEIASSHPFSWGTIDFWKEALVNAPVISDLSEPVIFQILDALLKRHRQISGDGVGVAMDAYAEKLVRNAEARLVQWEGR